MHIELVVIGNEVLSGFTVNTNAAFIGKELLGQGYRLSRQIVIPDDPEVMREEIAQALERSDLVITTGGLGPTIDDITRTIAAELFDSDFIYNEEIAKDIKARFKSNHPAIEDQATVPRKAQVFINPIGTAPGLILRDETSTLMMFPGVPVEMKPMFVDQGLPYIKQHFPLSRQIYRKALHLFELPELAVDPMLRKLKEKYPEIDFGIYPSLGHLSVLLTVEAENKQQAEKILEQPYLDLEREFATNCFHAHSGLLEEAVQHTFIENEWTLSVAESCTGGALSSRLTEQPGASKYFLGSVVSYANKMKENVLKVPEEIIRKHGAVSAEAAASMVEGILKLTGSDFALAVTGIAGPDGGTPEKPVGTVWCAVCRKGQKPRTWKHQARGTRQMIITWSVNSLLSRLLVYIRETSLL